jgi:hypothetical protein
MPPYRYRLTKYKTPAGQQAADEWFVAFRVGTAVARDSGLREAILVPLSGPITPVAPPPWQPVMPRRGASSQADSDPAATVGRPTRVLPPPRVVTDEGEDSPTRLPPPHTEPGGTP